MTRISTANSYDSTLDRLVSRQADLADAQARLTSGKRVARGSDDPTAAARSERALSSISKIESNQRAVDASRGMMSQTEGALADAGELLQQAREAMVAAGNASYSDAERRALSEQLKAIRGQLLAVANRGDGGDAYLFGGQGSTQPPFVDAPGGVSFFGVGGQTRVAGGEQMPLTLDGQATWLSASTGNGVFETRSVTSAGSAWIDSGGVTDPTLLYGVEPSTYDIRFTVAAGATTYSVSRTPLSPDGAAAIDVATEVAFAPGRAISFDGMSMVVTGKPADGDRFQTVPSQPNLSVFDALDKAVTDLATGSRTSTQIAQTNSQNLRNIDAAMARLQSARSNVGEILNNIDGVHARNDSMKLQAEGERVDAEDLDMVQAISEFQNKQSGYDAALKAYSMVQRLSLFQYING